MKHDNGMDDVLGLGPFLGRLHSGFEDWVSEHFNVLNNLLTTQFTLGGASSLGHS